MFGKSKKFRDAAEKKNLAELLEMELKKGDTNGTYTSHFILHVTVQQKYDDDYDEVFRLFLMW